MSLPSPVRRRCCSLSCCVVVRRSLLLLRAGTAFRSPIWVPLLCSSTFWVVPPPPPVGKSLLHLASFRVVMVGLHLLFGGVGLYTSLLAGRAVLPPPWRVVLPSSAPFGWCCRSPLFWGGVASPPPAFGWRCFPFSSSGCRCRSPFWVTLLTGVVFLRFCLSWNGTADTGGHLKT